MLKVGQIDYANVFPLFHRLQGTEGVKFIKGVPSFLNRAISEGAIDISFSSCIEYAKSYEDYMVLPGISISCLDCVKSVILFSSKPIAELEGCTVFLTGESGTSVVLFEILAAYFYKINIKFTTDHENADAHVYIGDTALFKYYNGDYPYVYDLCTEWNKFTGLPFVFALWIVRKDAVERMHDEVAAFAKKLHSIKEDSKRNLAALLDYYTFKGLTSYQIIDYWETIDYNLSQRHVEGLLTFYRYAVKIGRLKEVPPLNFFIA